MLSVKIFPVSASLAQYRQLLIEDVQYIRYYVNSVAYSISISGLQMAIGVLTAYALSCFPFKYRNALFFLFVAVMVLPFQATMASSYVLLDRLHLLNTPYSLILPGMFLPFCTFMFRQYFVGIPRALFDAATVDGANSWQILFKLVVPLSRALIVTGAILAFVDAWNQIEQPLIFIKDAPLYPLSLALTLDNNGDVRFAASTLFLLPPLLLFMYFYEDILVGIQMCDLK